MADGALGFLGLEHDSVFDRKLYGAAHGGLHLGDLAVISDVQRVFLELYAGYSRRFYWFTYNDYRVYHYGKNTFDTVVGEPIVQHGVGQIQGLNFAARRLN